MTTPEQNWTAEPEWRVETRNVPLADTGDFESIVEILVGNGGTPVAEIWNPEDDQIETFKRIVAEHNACAGMPDPAAEIEDMRNELKTLRDQYHSPVGLIATQSKQIENLQSTILMMTGQLQAQREFTAKAEAQATNLQTSLEGMCGLRDKLVGQVKMLRVALQDAQTELERLRYQPLLRVSRGAVLANINNALTSTEPTP